MSGERWQQIEKLYHGALEQAPAVRPEYLKLHCDDDSELRREVESLLAQGSGEGVLDRPAYEGANASLESEELSPGTQLGPYKIDVAIGFGGMGRVFCATDTRLGRRVAIKLLRGQFSSRFERECKAISALNHPNICTLYDVGPNYLVMELVEGESLAARMKRGQISLQETLEYALQIAQALETAHEKGVVHRDLKPANIMISQDGLVKVLDFGLAKTSGSGISGASESQALATDPGLILGTPAYMSPEQAAGQPFDKRSDIWSFGVVLYEMLAARRLFDGETVSHTLAAVLTGPIDLAHLPSSTPASVRELIGRCLDRGVKTRLRDIGEARVAVERYLAAGDAARPSKTRSSAIPWAAAALLGVIAAALGVVLWREKPPEAPVERFSIPAPENTAFDFTAMHGGSVEASPDGRRIVFSAAAEGKMQLWVRSLASLSPVALAGTEGAILPFWSADSENIGFFADGKLKRISPAGGLPITICDAPDGMGGTWNREGVIVFGAQSVGPLYRVAASGGTPSPVTTLDIQQKETTHRWPWFLPDGRHFLYETAGNGRLTIRAASIDAPAGNSPLVIPAILHPANVAYSQGYLLFDQAHTLMAQSFDAQRLTTTGEVVSLADHVQQLVTNGRAAFGVSTNGLLAYKSGPIGDIAQLTWYDRAGKQIGTLGQAANLTGVRISPDQKSVVINIVDSSTRNKDLWIYDINRGLKARFTFDPAEEREASWSRDGRWIAFNSYRKGHLDLYRKASTGAGPEELLYADSRNKYPTSFSPDGKLLLYMVYVDASNKNQLWILPLEPDATGERKPTPFAPSGFNSSWGQFSPDGHWIAYVSDESQRNEVYVDPFPGRGGKKQISTAGGDQPVWRTDGKEIFYVAPNGQMMAAEVVSKNGSLEVGTVRSLFGSVPALMGHGYDVSADGQRFLVRTVPQADEPLTVVRNWTALLRK
jgi:eukaryotic-like serine/threonine-protein kinase